MKYFTLFSFIFVFACNEKIKDTEDKDIIYDYEVLYRYQGEENLKNDKYRHKLSSDTLYILFESEFKKDKLVVFSDNKIVFNDKIDTEPSSGLAKEITLNINELSSLKLKFNNGPLIYVELIRKDHNIIGVRNEDNKISVVFYKKVPTFE